MVRGEDDELTTAIAQFHKMVDQENRAVSNATLAGVGATHADVKVGLAIAGRTERNTETIITSTGRMDQYIESMMDVFGSPFNPSNFLVVIMIDAPHILLLAWDICLPVENRRSTRKNPSMAVSAGSIIQLQ